MSSHDRVIVYDSQESMSAAAISGESAGTVQGSPEPAVQELPDGRVMPIGRRFEKGRSGNPSGRPRGIAREVRAQSGEGPHEYVAILRDIARTGKRDTDRIAACRELLAYGWGKPNAVPGDGIDITEADELTREIQALTDEIRKERAA